MTTNIVRLAGPVQRVILALALIASLSAFRHTDVEGYVDPEFVGYQFSTVVVQMPNAALDFKGHVLNRLEKQFRKLKIKMILHNDLFPPTRKWTPQAMQEVYEQQQVDAGLVITVGDSRLLESAGTVMYDATTINGITTGTATQIKSVSEHVSFQIHLVDAASRKTAWFGRLDTRGNGYLFIGNKSAAKGLVKGLFKEWKSTGFVGRR